MAQFPSIFSMLICFSVNFQDRNSVQQLKTVLITEPQDRIFCWTQFSCSVVSNSATPWTAARQTSLSITSSRSLPKLTSIESVMPSNHLVLCHLLLLPPSVFPSIRGFSTIKRIKKKNNNSRSSTEAAGRRRPCSCSLQWSSKAALRKHLLANRKRKKTRERGKKGELEKCRREGGMPFQTWGQPEKQGLPYHRSALEAG